MATRLYATYVASWSQATTCPDTKTLTGPIPNIFAQYAAVVFQTEVTCAPAFQITQIDFYHLGVFEH